MRNTAPNARAALARFCVTFLLLGVFGLPLLATPTPFDLNMDRVKAGRFGGDLTKAKTFIVPTVILYVSESGSVWAMSRNGDANAQAHAKFHVLGLDKAFVQDLARQIQDDLIAKLRAAGYTVKTYDDIKTHPDVVGHGRESPDNEAGLPTTSKESLSWIIVAPSDAQTFDRPIQGPAWWLKGVAENKETMVLVPEISFAVPQVYGESTTGYKRAEASINLSPAMKLHVANIWAVDGKGGTASIMVLEHGKRLAAEVTGTLKKVSEDKTNFTRSWGRNSSDYVFHLDPQAFSDGVLRVGFAINTMIVAQVRKGK
ncbi:MAG TPA: hypothetical protein VHD32_16595 [Candidatus Didemnitutus sp.]|nr:hypothetical protein [Candidatus Didemnitutus sp.]